MKKALLLFNCNYTNRPEAFVGSINDSFSLLTFFVPNYKHTIGVGSHRQPILNPIWSDK